MAGDRQEPADEELADQAAPLDALLVDAALGPMRRFMPDLSTARFAAGLLRRPGETGMQLAGLAAELGKIAVGRSATGPSPKDRRFTDPGWQQNPALRRILQAYLASAQTASQLVDEAGLAPRDEQRVRFGVQNLTEALAPSNLPLLNPAAVKAAVDSGGRSLAIGGLALLRDLAVPPRIPQMVDGSQFAVGRNVAVTPGAVVLRTDQLELIQYQPQTPRVHAIPVLIAPPTINKYYVLDLAPGRSLVEFLVQAGCQVFVVSWRNPDARHAGWGFSTYVQSVIDALDATTRISGSEQAVLFGFCSGGIIASMTAAYLAATGQDSRLAGLGLGVTVLDYVDAGLAAALLDRRMADAAKAVSRRRGYLDGRALAEVFAWLRPGDLVWNYWVNNYLLGRKPPAFDILFWNADTTRMTASLHADFVDLAMDNKLATPGAVSIMDVPIDLSKVIADGYVVAGRTDHLTPWQNCYRSAELLGGSTRFILSTSGHIAALVNPPGNAKASFLAGKVRPVDPAAWPNRAAMHEGSWWPDAASWLAKHCGQDRPAPAAAGNEDLPPLADAPGSYVFDS